MSKKLVKNEDGKWILKEVKDVLDLKIGDLVSLKPDGQRVKIVSIIKKGIQFVVKDRKGKEYNI